MIFKIPWEIFKHFQIPEFIPCIDSGEFTQSEAFNTTSFSRDIKVRTVFFTKKFRAKDILTRLTRIRVNLRLTIMCLGRQANMVLPGENAWSLDVCNKDNVGEKDD